MNRKNFLITSTLTAISFSTFGKIIKGGNGTFVGDCESTEDILGPFYRPDAPLRSDLTNDGLPGNRLIIKGKVFKEDCNTAIENAMVEIWHCDTKGEYDNDTNDFRQRGRTFANAKGEYSFKTILPGKYLNGELYRPAHIHFRVTEKESKELISQIYFEGDPHITQDPWASQAKAKKRILQITPEDTLGNLVINFDIYLTDI